MKKSIIISILLISSVISAQSNSEKSKQKAFQFWIDNSLEASNLFANFKTKTAFHPQ